MRPEGDRLSDHLVVEDEVVEFRSTGQGLQPLRCSPQARVVLGELLA